MRTDSSSQDPVPAEPWLPAGMLMSTMANSAATTPMTASFPIRSLSRATAISTVITGESETTGKIR